MSEQRTCARCGKPSNNRWYCPGCTSLVVAENKVLRADRRARGCCVYCGRATPAGNGECEKCNSRRTSYRRSKKAEAIRAYGGKCACCGEDKIEFLQIDHMNGGGSADHRSATTSIYSRLKKRGWPPGFQVLCANCNTSLGFFGYCPHRPEIRRAVLRGPRTSKQPVPVALPAPAQPVVVESLLPSRVPAPRDTAQMTDAEFEAWLETYDPNTLPGN